MESKRYPTDLSDDERRCIRPHLPDPTIQGRPRLHGLRTILDPAKKVEGRKRHLLVDTEGLVLEARVHSARVPDQDGIRLLLGQVQGRFARLAHLWVDAGYQGRGKKWVEEVLRLSVEVVRKPPKPVPEKVAEASVLPLFTGVRGRGVLQTSRVGVLRSSPGKVENMAT